MRGLEVFKGGGGVASALNVGCGRVISALRPLPTWLYSAGSGTLPEGRQAGRVRDQWGEGTQSARRETSGHAWRLEAWTKVLRARMRRRQGSQAYSGGGAPGHWARVLRDERCRLPDTSLHFPLRPVDRTPLSEASSSPPCISQAPTICLGWSSLCLLRYQHSKAIDISQ